MKSKSNPFLFRALASGAALFAITPLHAADVDTTGGVTLSAGNKYIGAGTLTANSGGDLWLGGSGDAPNTEFAMTGGTIDIVSGTTVRNGGWQKGVWTYNQATLQVNGTLDIFDGNDIFADALTGSGTVGISSGISWVTLNKSITVGVNGGGGTFAGTIFDSDDDIVSLIKNGGGTQILTGSNTYRGATTINGGTLSLGNGGATGSLSSSSAISVGSGATFVINQSDTVTQGTDFSSAGISGAGGFTKAGAGTTVLNATNTYTGGTTVTGGTLTLGTGGAVGVIRNSLTINSGATVSASTNWSLGYANGTSVTDITLNGGTLNFTGGSNMGGTTASAITFSTSAGTISGTDFDWYNDITNTPTLTVNAAASGSVISSGINLRLTSSGNLTVNVADGANSNDMLVSGVIRDGVSGSGASIIKTGAGTLTLSAANTYSGATTVNAGTLSLGNGGTTGSLANSSTISVGSGATFVINRSDTVTQGTDFSSADISGAGGFTQAGAGTTVLNASNTYTGATTISAGTLKLQGAAFSTTARAYSIASGAVLNLDGGAGVASGNTTISGTGTLRISGGGLVSGADARDLTLELGSGALIDIQSGANVYNGGWQNMTWTNNLAGLQVNGALEMGDGQYLFADALTGSGAVTMDVGWSTWEGHLIVGVNGGGGTFTGTISDSGDDTLRLTKNGGGTQILTGTNTYRGATTVSAGKLTISSTGTINNTSGVSIGAGEFNYNSTTALTQGISFSGTGGKLSGSGTINQAVSITTGNTLAIGNSVGQMNFGSTLGLAGTTVMEIDGTVGAGLAGGHDFANVTGALTYGGGLTLDLGTIFGIGTYSWNLFDFAGADLGAFSTITLADQYSGSLLDGDSNGIWDLNSGNNTWQFTESTGVLGLTVVPEPNVAALLGGLGVLALLRRRR